MISNEFQVDDIMDFRGGVQHHHKETTKFENKTLWSYTDAVKLDHKNTNAEEDMVQAMPMEERIALKLAEYEINIEEMGLIAPADEIP